MPVKLLFLAPSIRPFVLWIEHIIKRNEVKFGYGYGGNSSVWRSDTAAADTGLRVCRKKQARWFRERRAFGVSTEVPGISMRVPRGSTQLPRVSIQVLPPRDSERPPLRGVYIPLWDYYDLWINSTGQLSPRLCPNCDACFMEPRRSWMSCIWYQ